MTFARWLAEDDMRMNLTAKSVAALKPAEKRFEVFDTNLAGFGIRVTPNGVKTFGVMFRHGGRLRRLTIGTYPPLTLADARDRAKEALRAAQLGDDPAAAKIAARQAGTFEELADAYMDRWAKKRKRSWREDQRIIDRYLLPRWRNTAPGEIKRPEIRVMLEAQAKDAPIMANRTLACLRKIFSWALSQDLVESNPCQAIAGPGVEQRRDRVLSEAEIRQVWIAMEGDKHPEVAALFKLRLVTAQRGGEVATMRWSDIDFDTATWTIPSERSKNKMSHKVPLSEPALKILRELREARKDQRPWVFPNRRRPEEPTGELQKAHRRIRDAAGVTDYRSHDLRRTAASMMTSMGISRLVVGKILNHAEPGVTAVYDRHSYLPEMKTAFDAWGKQLMRIVKGLKAVEKREA